MKKKSQPILLIVILLVAIFAICAGIVYFNNRSAKNNPPSPITFNPLDATYLIENLPVTLVNGKFDSNTDPKISTAIFGQPSAGDLNGDGVNDAAVIITQDSGGSGIFYYVAAAINTANGAQGTNAILLGDRIAPQNVAIQDGRIIANYADRKAGEPMTTPPSVGVSAYFIWNGSALAKSVAPAQKVTYLVSSASTTKYCNGVDMDSAGYRKTITIQKSTSTEAAVPTIAQIIKTVISAATTGMCHTVMTQLNITENGGTVYIPAIEGWAGVSITMCSCTPQVEVNLLQIPGIKNVVWSPVVSNFEQCLATGNPITETYPRECKYGDQKFVENIGNELQKVNLITIENPRPNQTVSSPLAITGKARGSWFFEGSFPVVLTDWDGKIIAQGVAQAKSTWMTTDFVPFEATLTFVIDKKTLNNNGLLALRKDNPSGLPKNDDSLEIPVIFASATSSPVACSQEAKLCPDGSAVGRSGPNCEFAVCP